jgi:Glu-tRNA(Gln) amidotransferase subunit E-like FAD-binding protein
LPNAERKLPELPEARRARMIAEYELTVQDAHTLTASREFADRFERRRNRRNPRRVANVLLSEVGGRLKALGLEQEQSPVSMAGIVQAADLLDEGKISSKQLKQLFDVCFERARTSRRLRAREAAADHRRLGHRKAGFFDRRGHRRQPQAGGAVSRRQEDRGRILCRPGDEGVKGPGQPGAAE